MSGPRWRLFLLPDPPVRLAAINAASERKELENHRANSSWTTISASEVPAGRRIHKLIWVYKLKRDRT